MRLQFCRFFQINTAYLAVYSLATQGHSEVNWLPTSLIWQLLRLPISKVVTSSCILKSSPQHNTCFHTLQPNMLKNLTLAKQGLLERVRMKGEGIMHTA